MESFIEEKERERSIKIQLDYIRSQNGKHAALECLQTLHQIFSNIKQFPNDPKVRNIKEKNKVFQRVLNCAGGRDFVYGFSTQKVHDFESVFEFQDGSSIIPFLQDSIDAVSKSLAVVSEKEEERLYRLRILQEIAEDRERRWEKQARARAHSTHSSSG
jgi:hypothetical protein